MGKCALGRGRGPSPQENVSVPLSKHIYSSVFTDRQELTLCHYFKLQFGKTFGGEASPLPLSRLKPECMYMTGTAWRGLSALPLATYMMVLVFYSQLHVYCMDTLQSVM